MKENGDSVESGHRLYCKSLCHHVVSAERFVTAANVGRHEEAASASRCEVFSSFYSSRPQPVAINNSSIGSDGLLVRLERSKSL